MYGLLWYVSDESLLASYNIGKPFITASVMHGSPLASQLRKGDMQNEMCS